MKVIIEFDGHEEKEEYKYAINGGLYKSAIDEFSDYIFFRINKHERIIPEKYLEIIRQRWSEITEDL